MKRLLLSACLAGLAISGAAAQTATAPVAAEPAAASDKPIFPIFPRATASSKLASNKAPSGRLARVPLPHPRPQEADAQTDGAADDGTQAVQTVADATPADTQATGALAADAAPDAAQDSAPASAPEKAAAAEPAHMNTGHPQIDALVAVHARANNVPEALVHRIIVRESKYQKDLVGSCGCIGLMQIKLGTARGLGYTGDAQGLHDANTNLTYGVKYLAGAWRVAHGNHDRAVHYFARGYYEEAKRERLAEAQPVVKFERAHAPLDITPKPGARAARHAAPRTAQASVQ